MKKKNAFFHSLLLQNISYVKLSILRDIKSSMPIVWIRAYAEKTCKVFKQTILKKATQINGYIIFKLLSKTYKDVFLYITSKTQVHRTTAKHPITTPMIQSFDDLSAHSINKYIYV